MMSDARPTKLRRQQAAIAVLILVAGATPAVSAPANTLSELSLSLRSCVQAPTQSVGSELTILFALKRDGSLLGKPRITHSHLVGDSDAQAAFVADAIEALAKCLPVSITDALGGAIAGRPFSIRIGRRPRATIS
jgi:hypothetical protein